MSKNFVFKQFALMRKSEKLEFFNSQNPNVSILSGYSDVSYSTGNESFLLSSLEKEDDDSIGMSSAEFQAIKDMEKKAKHLKARLKDRPYDYRALTDLSIALFELKDYVNAAKVIKRIFLIGENSGKFHLLLVLELGVKEYKIALADPVIQKGEMHFFELAAMYVRLDKHQEALDVLANLMSAQRHDVQWVYICQYNIAHILFLRGEVGQAIKLMKELGHSTLDVVLQRSQDQIVLLPHRVNSLSVAVEVATMYDHGGDVALARGLYEELWNQVEKYRPGGKGLTFDFRVGTASFSDWYLNYKTFQSLGNTFKADSNIVMASEMYRIAVEKILKNDWDTLSHQAQEDALELSLLIAECLAEFSHFKESEEWAYFSFSHRPTHQGATARAARCVRQHLPKNADLVNKAKQIERAIMRIQSLLRVKVAKYRKRMRQREIAAGFTLTSFIRMVLVRNKMVERRLEHCPAWHITGLVNSFTVGKRVNILKTGTYALLCWREVWHHAALILQRFNLKWLGRHQRQAFNRGVLGFQRIMRGQRTRTQIRNFIENIQDKLDTDFDINHRREMTKDPLRKITANYEKVTRLCCGSSCITSEEYILGAIPLNAPESPLRVPLRNERRKDPFGMLPPVNKSLDARVEWFGALAKRSNHNQHVNQLSASGSVASHGQYSHSRIPGDSIAHDSRAEDSTIIFSRSSYRLKSANVAAFRESNPEEDIISFISYQSVWKDESKQWVPFGMLPESEIRRLLQCTVLVITSALFSVQDCKRLCAVARDLQDENWVLMKSIFISRTRMGKSGVLAILNLGIAHMQSLTITQSGISHHFGVHIGKQLQNISDDADDDEPPAGARDPSSTTLTSLTLSASSTMTSAVGGVSSAGSKFVLWKGICADAPVALRKIYIENEPHFGDRGITSLLKYLQRNRTVKILAIRGCNITDKGAISCGKYIVLSKSIEVINLGDNCLSKTGYLSVIRSVANLGYRGQLRNVVLRNQIPGFHSRDEMLKIVKMGSELGLKVCSDEVSVFDEIKLEASMSSGTSEKDVDKEEILRMKKVFEDIVNDDRLADDTIVTNSYKKVVYL